MDKELLECLTSITNKLDEISSKITSVEQMTHQIDFRVNRVQQTIFKIEQEHGEKLPALFDGYKQVNG
jgi:prefoldin subunit 5